MFKLKDVKLNNGATLDKFGNVITHKNGYQVSAEDLEIIPAYRLTKKHLIDMLDKIPHGSNLGIWIDNGKAYIDRSARISNKRLALKVGKELKQLSIYDWKTGECIPCLQ
jgi:hypothetical protein